jgi:hypothetical protein
VHVGLHHHGEQRLIDPAATLQQRREERAGPQLRDAQLHIPGRGAHQPIPVPVALGHPGRGSLVRCRPDPSCRLRVDQRLEHRLQRLTHHAIGVGDLQRLQQLQQGRLIQGHRACLLPRVLERSRKDSHGGPQRSGTIAAVTPLQGRDPVSSARRSDASILWRCGDAATKPAAPSPWMGSGLNDCGILAGRPRAAGGLPTPSANATGDRARAGGA